MVIKSDKTLPSFAAPMEKRSKFRQALPQILAVCVKNVLLLGFGMTLGFPTILIPSLSSEDPKEPFHLGQEAISWIGSINLICVPVGCLLSGMITQPIGRKRAMQFVNIPFLAAWLIFHFSTEVWQVFLALAITGLTGGLLEAPVLTYVAEITQPHLRGMLSSTSSMSVIVGLLATFLLGTFIHWRTVALISSFIPIVSFTSLIFVPETPLWLISKNRYLDARKSLAWLRGWTQLDEIELEFQEICKQLGKASDIGIDTLTPSIDQSHRTNLAPSKLEIVKLFYRKNFLWPFALVALTFFLGHFNGMQNLQTYAIKIFTTLNSPINEYYATVLLGTVQVIGTIICVTLVHFSGKRVLTLVSLLGTGLCFSIIAVYAQTNNIEYLIATPSKSKQIFDGNNNNYSWIPVTFLILNSLMAYVGIRVLPWILIGEVFSNETRAIASGLAAAAGYIFGFIANKIFLSLVNFLTLWGTFWLYACVSFIGMITMYFFLPETEGKTLFEITEHFLGNSKLDNKVKRKFVPLDQRQGHANQGFEDKETLTYVAEITQPSLRGVLASISTVAVISGILIQFLLGPFLTWKIITLYNCIVPILSFTLLFFIPESPHWLIFKNRHLDARKSLAWLRGWVELDEIEAEFKELCEQIGSKSRDEPKRNWKLYLEKDFLWPFGIVCYGFFLGHFSGMTTLQTYAVSIFSTLQVPIDKFYATILLGLAEVFGCILSVCTIHYVGKRVLNFFSLLGCGLCFLIVAIYSFTHGVMFLNNNSIENETEYPNTWIPMVFLIATAFFTHSGIRILPWMLIGEVYTNETRASGSGLSAAISYIFGFISNKIFLKMVSLITLPGTFWFYTAICLIGTVILYFILPETEGKTLFHITQHFSGDVKLDNKVPKKTKSINGVANEAYVKSNNELDESKL